MVFSLYLVVTKINFILFIFKKEEKDRNGKGVGSCVEQFFVVFDSFLNSSLRYNQKYVVDHMVITTEGVCMSKVVELTSGLPRLAY